MFGPFRYAFEVVVRKGDLRITDARGETRQFGDGTGEACAVRVTDRWTELKIAIDPWLAIGEAYMDGRLVVEEGDLYRFIDILLRNAEEVPLPRWTWLLDILRWLIRRVDQFNPIARARRNASAHYDIQPEIYRLFLDSDQQYSCAYFSAPNVDLDTAQLEKKRHLAAKLLISARDRVLDIGCGWGGLCIYLARMSGADVTGITLSREQLKIARNGAQEVPQPDRVTFRLEDYRETKGQFDKIVSVGMFEHVGVHHYRTFFRRLSGLLKRDGVALLHTIGRAPGPAPTNPFIKRYIFPGGSLPALSEVLPQIEASGLVVCDIEILRLHYAETLRRWRARFCDRWDEAVRLKGEKFCRMWEFYLAGSEASFRYQGLVVFQIQLAHSQTAVPLTRDYIGEEEARLAQCERFGRKRKSADSREERKRTARRG
ncbi:MAG: cyclopropane-fatty-acyl-phospholipid synthase family protein [Hyphomicrobiaceae bacterium]|nr:cyclopropane-fatty-acyl-phospholipid synthase family protein [Hyphomicrobiaceae bacterium]